MVSETPSDMSPFWFNFTTAIAIWGTVSKWRRLVERNFKDSHFTPFLLCFPARVLPDYVDGLGELFQVLLLSLPALILHHLPGGQELIIMSYFLFSRTWSCWCSHWGSLCTLSGSSSPSAATSTPWSCWQAGWGSPSSGNGKNPEMKQKWSHSRLKMITIHVLSLVLTHHVIICLSMLQQVFDWYGSRAVPEKLEWTKWTQIIRNCDLPAVTVQHVWCFGIKHLWGDFCGLIHSSGWSSAA